MLLILFWDFSRLVVEVQTNFLGNMWRRCSRWRQESWVQRCVSYYSQCMEASIHQLLCGCSLLDPTVLQIRTHSISVEVSIRWTCQTTLLQRRGTVVTLCMVLSNCACIVKLMYFKSVIIMIACASFTTKLYMTVCRSHLILWRRILLLIYQRKINRNLIIAWDHLMTSTSCWRFSSSLSRPMCSTAQPMSLNGRKLRFSVWVLSEWW